MKGCLRLWLCVWVGFGWASAQKLEPVLQTGHTDSVLVVAVTADGRLLASGGADRAIVLWDVNSGSELRKFAGQRGLVVSLAFSPDGARLAGSGADGTVKLWRVSDGQEQIPWPATPARGFEGVLGVPVVFSPDGNILASAGTGGQIRFWDVRAERILPPWAGHNETVRTLAFSPDGKILACGSDKTIKLWRVADRQELATLAGHTNLIRALAFSPDGLTLASGSWDKSVRLWGVPDGQLRAILNGHQAQVNTVAFSPDGSALASGSSDNSIKIWNVATNQEKFALMEHTGGVTALAFAPPRHLVSAGADGALKQWDLASRRVAQSFTGLAQAVWTIALSRDGKTLASGDTAGTLKLWDLATGQVWHTLAAHQGQIWSVAFSPTQPLLASAGDDNVICLWDTMTGQKVRELRGHTRGPVGQLQAVIFSPDGKLLASGGAEAFVRLWDVETGQQLRALPAEDSKEVVSYLGIVRGLAFSLDGWTLAAGGGDGHIKLWDVATGAKLQELRGHTNWIRGLALSPDGQTLASASLDGTVRLWRVATGEQLARFPASELLETVAFSPDGKLLAGAGQNNTVTLWDVAEQREARQLVGHEDSVLSVIFSPDGRFLLSGGQDATVRLWRVSDGQLLATLVALAGREWLALTPDGLFDGASGAWGQIRWRFNGQTFDTHPVEIFFSEYFRPGLVTDLLAGASLSAPRDLARIDRRQPVVTLSAAQTGGAKSVKVTVKVAAARGLPAGGARDVRLFRNGALVKIWRGPARLTQGRAVLSDDVPLAAGENRFTAYAFNNHNVRSSEAKTTVTGAARLKRGGTLYVLAVGVNEYAAAGQNLNYAVADVQALGREIKARQANLGQYERVEVVELTDADATGDNIRLALRRFATGRKTAGVAPDALRKIAPAQPEDALVIAFSGHGQAIGDRFYLVPHDGFTADGAVAVKQAVSDRDLEELLAEVGAGRLLLILDACRSGQALASAEQRRGPLNANGLAQLAYEKGMSILAASQSYQDAQESPKLGHGFLTAALLEGLQQPVVADNRGQVTERAWLDYAAARVPVLQSGAKTKGPVPGSTPVRVVGDAPAPAPERQRPRVYYRREPDLSPLIVARH